MLVEDPIFGLLILGFVWK